jgi:hypothetical protein
MRDVYIKPSAEFELNANQVLKLLRPLYGLADSGDYCGSTLINHLKEELGMKQTVGDPAMFFVAHILAYTLATGQNVARRL